MEDCMLDEPYRAPLVDVCGDGECGECYSCAKDRQLRTMREEAAAEFRYWSSPGWKKVFDSDLVDGDSSSAKDTGTLEQRSRLVGSGAADREGAAAPDFELAERRKEQGK